MVKDARLMLIWVNLPIPFAELHLDEVPDSLFAYSSFLLVFLLCLYRRWVLMLGVYSTLLDRVLQDYEYVRFCFVSYTWSIEDESLWTV